MVNPEFVQHLHSRVGKELRVRINNNRSTMLAVRWEKSRTCVSLHRIFLQAPQPVQEALVRYLRREEKRLAPSVKAFIEENHPAKDYSHKLDVARLVQQGTQFDLQDIYDRINQEYFEGKLELKITWFGKPRKRFRSRWTLGLYHSAFRLVKIHRMLDHVQVPAFVIEYIVYHEMVHAICPVYVDTKGIHRIHSKEFKEIERRFRHYKEAQVWLKLNRQNFVSFSKDVFYL